MGTKTTLTFLGTGTSQGVPVIACDCEVCNSKDSKDKRLRASVMFTVNNKNIVVDTGPDFRQQMLRAQCTSIDGVIFTHEHADHTMGLDDIRPFFFRQGDIPIYAHKRVLEGLKIRFDYIFASENKYPGAPSVIENEIINEPFALENIDVIPINTMHNRLQVFGFRFKDFAYLTDVKTIEPEEKLKLNGEKGKT